MAPGILKSVAIAGGIGASLAVGYWLTPTFLKNKLKKLRHAPSPEKIDLLRRQQYFDSNQAVCDEMVYSMLPSVNDVVKQHFDPGSITDQLRAKSGKKIELWNELKITSFGQLMSLVYSSSLLAILLRVELNILAGFMYQDRAADSKVDNDGLKQFYTSEIEKRYLTTVQFLLQKGIPELCKMVENAVHSIFDGVDLKNQLSVENILQYIQEVHQHLTNQMQGSLLASEKSFVSFLFGEKTSGGSFADLDKYDQLICSTLDVLDCPDLLFVIDCVFQKGFGSIAKVLQDSFLSALQGGQSPTLLPLARIIPLVTDASTGVLRGAQATGLIQEILYTNELSRFSYNICEAFSVHSKIK